MRLGALLLAAALLPCLAQADAASLAGVWKGSAERSGGVIEFRCVRAEITLTIGPDGKGTMETGVEGRAIYRDAFTLQPDGTYAFEAARGSRLAKISGKLAGCTGTFHQDNPRDCDYDSSLTKTK